MAEDAGGPTIPWIGVPLPPLPGPFLRNVHELLGALGREHRIQAWRGRAWTLALPGGPAGRHLHVYEERFEGAERAGCEQCRCNGWQHHPMSNHRFHFVLPTHTRALDAPVLPIDAKGREACGRPLGPACLESKHHVLHGVLHSNGHGHLLRINGVEGGSGGLPGRLVMDFWDAMCAALAVQRVSIEDISSRRGMLLRTLHAAAHGRTWYGEWGYTFGRAGYNIQEGDWQSAVGTVNGAPLAGLLEDFRAGGVDPLVVRIVERYRGSGAQEVATLGDWLKRLMEFTHEPERAARFLADQEGPASGVSGREATGEAEGGRELPALARALPQIKAALELAGLQVEELLQQGSWVIQAQDLAVPGAPFGPAPCSLPFEKDRCGDGEVAEGLARRLLGAKEEPWSGEGRLPNGTKGEPTLECREPGLNASRNKTGGVGGHGPASASGSSNQVAASGHGQSMAVSWVKEGGPMDVDESVGRGNGVNGEAVLAALKTTGQCEGDGLWKRLSSCPRAARSPRSPRGRRSSNGFQQGAAMGAGVQGGRQAVKGNGTAETSSDAGLLSVLRALGEQGDAWQQAAAAWDPRLLTAVQLAMKGAGSQANGEVQDVKQVVKARRRSDTTGRWVSPGQNGATVESIPAEILPSASHGKIIGGGAKQPMTAPPKVMHKRRQPAGPGVAEAIAACNSGTHPRETSMSLPAPPKPEAGSWAVKNPLNGRFKQKQKQPVSFNGAYEPPTDLVKPAVKPFDPKLLLQGPRNWSAHKLVEFLRIVLSVLQTIEGHWVKLQELRELLYATAHDRVLADWVLGRLANTTFANGCVVYKTRSESGRRNFFLFEALKNKRNRARQSDGCPPPPSAPAYGGRPFGDTPLPPTTRFDKFLSDVFKWLCANPHVQVGKPTVSKRPAPEPCDGQEDDGDDSEDLHRVTRSRTEAAMMRELRQLEPEKNLLENLASARARERRKRPGPGDHGYSRPAKKSRGVAGHKARQGSRGALVQAPRIQQALDKPDIPWMHGPRSAVDSFLETLERRGTVPGAPALGSVANVGVPATCLKDQQMADLLYIYQNVLESYMPLYFQDGKFKGKATPESASKLCLANLPDAVQVLMDTKLFIKEYKSGPKLVLPQKPGDPRLVRVVCQVDVVPPLPKSYKDRSSAGETVKVPSFFTRKPPPMPVYVPERCDLEEVKRCITCAFKETYLMFKDWSVVHIHGLRFGGRKSRLMPVDEGVVVVVKGKGIHNEPELRHAGEVADWEVSCRCGAEDDDGERMVACDQCGVWMHVRCAGFRIEDELPELFECPTCVTKRRSEAGSSAAE